MYKNLPINKGLFEYLRNLNHEMVYCFGDTGFVFKKSSGINPYKVDFTIQERIKIRHFVNCIVHNHCNNSSLSLNDFLLAVMNNVKTVVAISQDYLWRLDFELPFINPKETVENITLTYDDLRLSIGQPLHGHITWSTISKQYPSIKYEVMPL